MIKNIYFFGIAFLVVSNLQATSLKDAVEDTLNNNPSIEVSNINTEAFLKYVEQEEGDYLPTIDLDGYLEKSKTYNDPDNSLVTKGWSDKKGANLALQLSYILYDGGLSSAQVGESQHKYNANKFKNINDTENTILETINVYIDLVELQDFLALTQDNINIHEKYLNVAKEKEEVSGEVLETYQVLSKYHTILDKYLVESKEQHRAKHLYKELVGKELSGNICRPAVNEEYIPSNVKEAVEIGLQRSFRINEQLETIKAQRKKIAIEQAGYLPTIKFELQGQWDKDLELANNGKQDIYRGRIYLNWNLFDGGKTLSTTGREKLFLKEEQKKLDAITTKIVEEINIAYYRYFNTKTRIENLSKQVKANYNILKVYHNLLQDGTKQFIDILNAESELYRSDIDLVEQEQELYRAYYDLLNKLSMLSDVVINEPSQVCEKYNFTPRKREFVEKDQETTVLEDLEELINNNATKKKGKELSVNKRLNRLYNSKQINDTSNEFIIIEQQSKRVK